MIMYFCLGVQVDLQIWSQFKPKLYCIVFIFAGGEDFYSVVSVFAEISFNILKSKLKFKRYK